MTYSDFRIGSSFWTDVGEWRCTDIGMRVIVAIPINSDAPSWSVGPPYAVAETVFDENDMPACRAKR